MKLYLLALWVFGFDAVSTAPVSAAQDNGQSPSKSKNDLARSRELYSHWVSLLSLLDR
ncbi:hypothetical protein MMC29_002668 [Sticta canariensis]|nr:hypothetical protein [Sticta canariensis]